MLWLVGLGLGDESGLSECAISVLRGCAVYCELYTSKWFGDLQKLEKKIGKPIKILQRADLEERLPQLLNTAEKTDVAVLVPGDPLAATTHIDLLIEARKRGIEVKIIHNASIFSAIAETGLQLYKFGKAATVPFSGDLSSVRDALESNKKINAHTLLLLDVDSPNERYLEVKTALELLIKAKLIGKEEKIVAAARLEADPVIAYGNAQKLSARKFPTPAVLVVPGNLHFREKEALEQLK